MVRAATTRSCCATRIAPTATPGRSRTSPNLPRPSRHRANGDPRRSIRAPRSSPPPPPWHPPELPGTRRLSCRRRRAGRPAWHRGRRNRRRLSAGFATNLISAAVRLGAAGPEHRPARARRAGTRPSCASPRHPGPPRWTISAAAPSAPTSPPCATKPSTRGCSAHDALRQRTVARRHRRAGRHAARPR